MACKAKAGVIVLLFLLLGAVPAPAVTPPVPAQPHEYVVDLARVIDAHTTARLKALLQDLEAKTTAQMVVLTLNSLEGESIETFSHRTAVQWKIGQKGKDNGVLLTVAVKDRKYRIEVGYGLESVLPDSLVGSIGRQFLAPHFKKGDFGGGIMAAVAEMAKIISGGKVAAPGAQGKPPYHWETVSKKELSGLSLLTLILLPIFLILFIIYLISRFFGVSFGGYSSGDSGWSSGGGDSGFSGGGGDFGGGGASGDW